MIDLLKKHILKVTFTKKDGSLREMECTLIPQMIPEVSGNPSYSSVITTVFDLEKDQWRSFRNDSIINYEIVD